MVAITGKDVKKEICKVVWQELKLKEQGFDNWSCLFLKDEFDLFHDLGADDVLDKARLHEVVERKLRVNFLCREFESVKTVNDITKAVCFKKGIKIG